MLVGRESLVRLVGKRKRTLSSPAAISLRHSSSEENDAGDASDSKAGGGGDGNGDGWVNCPVCGRSIAGSDLAVNSHLDLCLSTSNKRKASQRTLLQLNFFSKKNNNSFSTELNGNILSFVPELKSAHSFEANESQADSLAFANKSNEVCNDDHTEKIDIIDSISGKIKDEVSYSVPEVRVLETVIVGHRFYSTVGLWSGARISFVREPENPFDQHAIKALFAISGNQQTVGHLPQKLAKYLSPLIDEYGLKIEGFVASLPSHPHDDLRVDLICHQKMDYSQIKEGSTEDFEALWENSIRIIEQETFGPNKMKYQQNFVLVIREVRDQYAQLFTHEEKSFLDSFGSLSDNSQRLFIRLYSRKGPWFRMHNLCYSEVTDSKKAIKELHGAGYFYPFQYSKNSSKSDVREVANTLTVYELREVAKLMFLKKGLNNCKKEDLIDCLFTAYEVGTCPLLPRTISEMAGTCVKISTIADSLLWRVQRLFFLNGEQDLSAFLLVDLGMVKYPTYVCNISKPIFRNRRDFIAYEEAIEVAQIMDESLEANDINMINKCIEMAHRYLSTSFEANGQDRFMYFFSALWVYSKVVTLGVSYLESQKRYEDATKFLNALLEKCQLDRKRGYWTLRLSVDLEHMGFVNKSLSVAEEGLLDSCVRAGSRIALQKRVLRLGKPPRRWKVPDFADFVRRKIPQVTLRGRPLNCKTGAKNRYYGYDGEQCTVENLALQYYADEGGGWRGVHTESGIWLTIFGLLMWDVLFADIPDVFRTRFQTAPLDLETDSFYSSRKDLIESRLLKIQLGMAEELLIISYESHLNTSCRGLNWDRHELSELRAAVSCLGGRSIAAVCRQLASDYRTWSGGMPDLLLWRFRGEEDGRLGEAKLVEVKGPRDKLSEQQRAWMLFLLDNGIDAEICQVSPT